MEYKLPPLPEPDIWKTYWPEHPPTYENFRHKVTSEAMFTEDRVRQYAEQAVAPLLAEIERLEKELALLRGYQLCA